MEIPQNLEEWEAMRKRTAVRERIATDVANQVLPLAHDYSKGLLTADDFVTAVQRTVFSEGLLGD